MLRRGPQPALGCWGVWGELQSGSLGVSPLEAFIRHVAQSLSTATRRRIMFEQKDF